mgnify:CR=1 FL=1
MSFDFLTKELQIPVEKLSVTVFAGDEDCPRDEVAANCWKKAGILDGHIYYYGKDETGGLQEKKDHVDQIQKCFTIQENQHVQITASQVATVVNMLKYGIMYLWNILKTKMETIQN